MERSNSATNPDLSGTPDTEKIGSGQRKVLVISFSQSGQLAGVVASLLAPLRACPSVEVVCETLRPIPSFPFPWPAFQFLDAFAESFLETPCALEPPQIDLNDSYDLVIIAYQVWYLAPSIPVSSFLQSEAARALLNNKPVVTIVACRNMWVRAHDRVKGRLRAASAHLVGHIALTDRALNLVSAVTIVAWMLTGKRDRLLGLFPKPGISERDVARCALFGKIIADSLTAPTISNVQIRLSKLGACNVVPHLLALENIGARIFKRWSVWIAQRGKPGDPRRRTLVWIFGWYLICAIALASPLSFLAFYMMLPFRRRGLEQQVQSVQSY